MKKKKKKIKSEPVFKDASFDRMIMERGLQCGYLLKDEQVGYPVVTLVLYFGTKKWDAPINLHNCLENIPKELKPYVNDYKINLFQIAFLSQEKVNMFKSDFRIIADFFVQKRINVNYKPSNKTIKYVDAFLKLMYALTGDELYLKVDLKGDVKTMCDVLQGAKEEGKLEEKVEIAKNLLLMQMPIEDISKATGLTVEEINTLH